MSGFDYPRAHRSGSSWFQEKRRRPYDSTLKKNEISNIDTTVKNYSPDTKPATGWPVIQAATRP
jgi:hypothetical protein